MDVYRLSLLRELAERGSVAAVADAMNVTASAVSQQLKVLEREAGFSLIEPSGRGVRLTVAGQALARTATEIAVAIAQAEGRWREFMAQPAGTVRLSTFQTAGEMLLPGVLHRMAQLADIELVCSDQDGLATDFESMTPDYDIVIADSPRPVSSWRERGLKAIRLMTEPLDVAMAEGHELARKSVLTPADVVDQTWIGVPHDYPFDHVLQRVVATNGRPAKVAQRISDNGIVEALVAAGHGIAILPRFTTRVHGNGLVTRPLAGMNATREIVALLRPDRYVRPSVRRVMEALSAEAAAVQAAHSEN
jgi:DNA-binding transcriptional LysR family regulator